MASTPATAADDEYKTRWATLSEARRNAEKSRYGMVLYFPPLAALDSVHKIFKEEELASQSLKSPMVRVQDKPEHKKTREKYEISGKYYEVVVTDYFGNPMAKPFKVKSESQKISTDQIIKLIRTADNYVDQMRVVYEKKIEKAERAFEREKWKSALKEYLPIAEFQGLKVSERARKRVAEIVEAGKKELAAAKKLEANDAKKALKKIAREFSGCEVEQLAEAALEKLES